MRNIFGYSAKNTETSETVYFNGNLMFACVDNWDDEKNWAPSLSATTETTVDSSF